MESVLIANRGEIARRIIRTARRLGIRTIAVYSTADAGAPFVNEADSAVAIGAAPARDSYLSGERILAAARSTRAAAIHPGYGFLSENAAFAEAVQAAGLVWVGAPPAAIRAMGLKDAAKALMIQAGVPVTPGYLGEHQQAPRLQAEAAAIGFPILIKAVAGGGGKGMRRVDSAEAFEGALASCRREAAAAFGDDRVLLEKFIESPRHIEVQVFGDTHGEIVHLFERDCSLQRRHQKVIEEAPAPGMDDTTREFICRVAVTAAQAVSYVGAGTIEFIADASRGLNPERIWFMEMNTRLQVEHPVTEAITGQDLVEWQLRVASGERLPCRQTELRIEGCAMEARLYAENPTAGFLPSTGPLRHLRLPTGIRVDSGVEEGDEITGFYDPMIAKLIVHAGNRAAAARRLAAACASVEVWRVHTNAAFLARVAGDPAFVAGDIDTGFIERRADTLIPAPIPSHAAVMAAARALVPAAVRPPGPAAAAIGARFGTGPDPWPGDPWTSLTGFRANLPPYLQVAVAVGDDSYTVSLKPTADSAAVDGIDDERAAASAPVYGMDGEQPAASAAASAVDERAAVPAEVHNIDGERAAVLAAVSGIDDARAAASAAVYDIDGERVLFLRGEAWSFGLPSSVRSGGAGVLADGALRSPMPGRIVSVSVVQGQGVIKGQALVALEAMKMEHALVAPFDGTVAELSVAEGDQVAEGVTLVRIVSAESGR